MSLYLPNDEIQVWSADLDVDRATFAKYWQLLSPDEKTRANKYRFSEDRRSYVAAKGILRILLAKYTQQSPQKIAFQYTDYQKPYISHDLQFNVSHSSGRGLFGFVHKIPIGVDIEYALQPVEIELIAPQFFTPNEAAALRSLPASMRLAGFYNCWTRKEAIIKAIGQGLSFPLDQFEVSLHPDQPAELLVAYWDKDEAQAWKVWSYAPFEDFKGAVAVRGDAKHIHWRHFLHTEHM